jgi:hypothetical protein
VIGTSLGLTAAATPWTGSVPAAPAFTPADLFAAGARGFWYDIDPAYLRQSSNGTGAVAVGDPVGWVQDRSGNGRHATQPTSAARPVLRQAGALHYLDFDGVDDDMTAPSFGALGNANREFMGAGRDVAFTYSLTDVSGQRWTVASAEIGNVGRVEIQGSGFTSSLGQEPSVFGVRLQGTTLGDHVLRKNGVDQAATGSNAINTQDNGIWLARRNTVNPPRAMEVFGAVFIDRVLTSTERTSLEQFLADKSGIAL